MKTLDQVRREGGYQGRSMRDAVRSGEVSSDRGLEEQKTVGKLFDSQENLPEAWRLNGGFESIANTQKRPEIGSYNPENEKQVDMGDMAREAFREHVKNVIDNFSTGAFRPEEEQEVLKGILDMAKHSNIRFPSPVTSIKDLTKYKW